MMSGAPRSGRRYWLTSVPHTPATATFSSAASGGISGRSISRNSVLDGPTFIAVNTFFDNPAPPPKTRSERSSPRAQKADFRGSLAACQTPRGRPPLHGVRLFLPALENRAQTRINLDDVLLLNLPAIVVGQPRHRVEARLVVVEEPPGLRIDGRDAAE